MDKKIAGLLGAAAALATVGGASAANATEVPGNPGNPAANYRELLNPVPNALAALKADDARRANESTPGEKWPKSRLGLGWDIITITTTTIWRREPTSASLRGTTTTIITITIITAFISAIDPALRRAELLAISAPRGPEQIAVGPVEYSVCA